MAGQGRRAQGAGESRQTLRSDGKLGGYPLPEGALPDGELWHPVTQRWWENFRKSPQGTLMVTDVDWDFLLDTALIHHNMWKNGRWEFANEVRMRVAQFGATPAARRALKMEIEVPEPFSVGAPGGATVSRMDDARKKRLTAGGA